MTLEPTAIAGLFVAKTMPRRDARGEFGRLFCERDLRAAIGGRHVVQANLSMTYGVGSVRGLHFQRAPHAEMKLVRCIRGCVFDVAIDLRAGSPTFLRWSGHELSTANGDMLVIPEGFAHGFQVLEPGSELLYLHTAFYEASAECGLSPADPVLGVRWPLPIAFLSERDKAHPFVTPAFLGFDP